jgi:hypothetical protein
MRSLSDLLRDVRQLAYVTEVIEFSPMMMAYFAQLEAESNG